VSPDLPDPEHPERPEGVLDGETLEKRKPFFPLLLWPTEAEGLEPPRACARRISSAVPYQLGLRLQVG
jgi:hypothetical protein